MKPRRKRTAFFASSRAAVTTSKVSSTVHDPAQIFEMRLAGIDDGFELGVRQEVEGIGGSSADSSVPAERPMPSRPTAPALSDAASASGIRIASERVLP